MSTTDPSHARKLRRAVRNAGPVLVRARLLLSSYAALNLILFARLESSPLKVFCLALALIGLGDGLRLSWLAQEKVAVPRKVASVQDAGPEVAGYLATYLLPLLAAPSPTTGDLFGYGIYGLVVILVWLRSNMAHVNPTLYLLGWRVTQVTFVEEDQSYLIARHVPRPGDEIRVARLSGVLHAK
jgi:hypothetical protein